MSEIERWKKKYSRLLDDYEQLEHQGAQRIELLQRGLVRAQTAMYGEQQAGDAALLPQRVDQLVWLGLSETSLQRLAPHVSVLPLQGGQITPVNLNTAGLEVLQAVWPGLDRARAQRLVQLRERQPLRSVQEAADALAALLG